MLAFLAAILPTIGVTFVFWLAIRSMLRSDAQERAALAAADKAEQQPDDAAE